jgi:hypothetical protein
MSQQGNFSSKELKLYTEKALTADVGQRSRQTFVLFLHRKVVLAYVREILDNRLHQKHGENQHKEFGLEGKPKCKHLDSPSGATDGGYSISKKQSLNSHVDLAQKVHRKK